MAFKVHNTQSHLSDEALSYLSANGCEVSYHKWQALPEEEEVICREIRGMHAVIAGGEYYTRKVFDTADQLKIIARSGAGYDRVDLAEATAHGVWVTNTPGATSPAVSEFTMGLILCMLRNIHGMAQDMKRGKWEPFHGRELGKLTLGIVGAGSIGQAVIKQARGFGTKILAYDIRPCQDFASKWQVEYVPLDDLMSLADVVSIHVSLNEHTLGLINERRLKLMKESAYLVNTSRAPVVDRADLLKVLQAKRIAGAALDVHDPAPCAPDDPLVLLDNVLATPWSAFNTEGATARMAITAAKDVVAVLHGRVPEHPVNKLDLPPG